MMAHRFRGGGWQPNSDRRPLLWLRADVGVSVSSGVVTSWADQSGNGHNFAARSSPNRPAWSATAWSSNRPGIVFGSSYTELVNTDAGLANLGAAIAVRVHLVMDRPSNAARQKVYQWLSIGGNYGAYEYEAQNDKDQLTYSSGGVVTVGSTYTGKHVLSQRIRVTASSPDSLAYIDKTNSINTNPPTAGSTDMFAIGGNALLGTNPLSATIAELVIYDISAGDYDVVSKFDDYAKAKWGGLP